jgi:hypothetical protein
VGRTAFGKSESSPSFYSRNEKSIATDRQNVESLSMNRDLNCWKAIHGPARTARPTDIVLRSRPFFPGSRITSRAWQRWRRSSVACPNRRRSLLPAAPCRKTLDDVVTSAKPHHNLPVTSCVSGLASRGCPPRTSKIVVHNGNDWLSPLLIETKP